MNGSTIKPIWKIRTLVVVVVFFSVALSSCNFAPQSSRTVTSVLGEKFCRDDGIGGRTAECLSFSTSYLELCSDASNLNATAKAQFDSLLEQGVGSYRGGDFCIPDISYTQTGMKIQASGYSYY
ncbi:hypothetical protein FACS1894125_3530 [Actinomycetota bacterium]|nr:hypothetical protein FACS1894125_3530 [Actinomycetota bacterium]